MLFTVILVFGLAASWSPIADACRCAALADPAYCRTEFLALVKITGSTVNPTDGQLDYSFVLVQDISYGTALGTLATFSVIKTAESTAACGVYLEVGKTYLLGGALDDATNQPTLNSCQAYWQEWPYTGLKSTVRAEKIRAECLAFHLTNSG